MPQKKRSSVSGAKSARKSSTRLKKSVEAKVDQNDAELFFRPYRVEWMEWTRFGFDEEKK